VAAIPAVLVASVAAMAELESAGMLLSILGRGFRRYVHNPDIYLTFCTLGLLNHNNNHYRFLAMSAFCDGQE
jgi:hypothetical protein